MTATQTIAPTLESLPIGVFLSPDVLTAPDAPKPYVLPTPHLAPDMVQTVMTAYDAAVEELRARSNKALPPSTRHALANKILRFAIFGERDEKRLVERALAHFG
jgi:hypothetical protein